MCAKKQYKIFMLSGCVTYTVTLIATVFNVIYIVKGFMNNVGAWPIIGMIVLSVMLLIIGGGLGFLFQAVAYFVNRFSSYKCVYPNNVKKE